MSCSLILLRNTCPVMFDGKPCESDFENIDAVNVGYDFGLYVAENFSEDVDIFEGNVPGEDVYTSTHIMDDKREDLIDYCRDMQEDEGTPDYVKIYLGEVIELVEEAIETPNSVIVIDG